MSGRLRPEAFWQCASSQPPLNGALDSGPLRYHTVAAKLAEQMAVGAQVSHDHGMNLVRIRRRIAIFCTMDSADPMIEPFHHHNVACGRDKCSVERKATVSQRGPPRTETGKAPHRIVLHSSQLGWRSIL